MCISRWEGDPETFPTTKSTKEALQAQLAASLGLDADNVTGTMVNQYINEGASLTLGNTITSCMGSADSSAARTTCSTTEAKALLVQKNAHAACSHYLCGLLSLGLMSCLL